MAPILNAHRRDIVEFVVKRVAQISSCEVPIGGNREGVLAGRKTGQCEAGIVVSLRARVDLVIVVVFCDAGAACAIPQSSDWVEVDAALEGVGLYANVGCVIDQGEIDLNDVSVVGDVASEVEQSGLSMAC